ncbi:MULTISPECIES: ABC-three component system protein [Bacillus]|uniref:ABC-three component system protein n=1 Tax=Bacillus TaxID=1386 RepID=UPI000B9C31F6|nr:MULTISPECIES: ABC-three component system protein [Bacillus]KAB7666913.1 hypothetical protein F9279_16775 [Bacillus sp. B1-b2]MCK6205773.1 hypothetical protein [Bacillus infantis]OXT17159.1 hypothetical protein B9K06_12415 [Bacillus sp. OG2]
MIERNHTLGPNSPIYNNSGDVNLNLFSYKNEVINPYNLKKIIEFLERELDGEIELSQSLDNDDDLKRIDIIEKNLLNKLEDEQSNVYFRNIIESSIYFKSIKDILSNPRNRSLKKSYNNIKKTINNKIPDIKREKIFFYEVLNEIIDRFINTNDAAILDNEEMVSIIIHFMYYICHIGENIAEAG